MPCWLAVALAVVGSWVAASIVVAALFALIVHGGRAGPPEGGHDTTRRDGSSTVGGFVLSNRGDSDTRPPRGPTP